MDFEKSDKMPDSVGRVEGRVKEISNTIEWMIIAFVLAFIFRTFGMEAFRIPTGSMADTLKGAHYRVRCPQCGWSYDYGYESGEYGGAEGSEISKRGRFYSKCPSCGYLNSMRGDADVSDGDRILVLKCLYQFRGPQRWDVLVFKNPLEPDINYIKRVVGLPGEMFEIIDGDIYVNGKITRKPAKVQEGLWNCIYEHDYRPVEAVPEAGSFDGGPWRVPFDVENSKWEISGNRFSLVSSGDELESIAYDSEASDGFRTCYAYNDIREYSRMPYSSDLLVRYFVKSDSRSLVGVSIRKYETKYLGWVDFSKKVMVISRARKEGELEELICKKLEFSEAGKLTALNFSNADHMLRLKFGDEELVFDLGREAGDAGPILPGISPEVRIFGRGKVELSHFGIYRDIHYTSSGSGPGTGTEGRGIGLEEDEFFVLGDNSPFSLDGRWWDEEGIGNNGRSYRMGIVPREYLVGKAVFVYWPGFFKPFDSNLIFVPNFGEMRVIHGG